MRELETWEMLKEITEKPYKKFKRVMDGLEVSINDNRYLKREGGHPYINIDHTWVEVELIPVEFVEAFEAWSLEDKDILCDYRGEYVQVYKGGEVQGSITLEQTIYGSWYIL